MARTVILMITCKSDRPALSLNGRGLGILLLGNGVHEVIGEAALLEVEDGIVRHHRPLIDGDLVFGPEGGYLGRIPKSPAPIRYECDFNGQLYK